MRERPRGARWVLGLLSCLRFDEILVLQGPPLFGAIFSIRHPGIQTAWDLPFLLAGNGLLVAHVFLFNDWAGIRHDLHNPSRSAGVFLHRGIHRHEVAGLSWVLLGLGLVLLGQLNPVTLALGLLVAIGSVLYSTPSIHLKGVPVLNSALHLVCGLLHFLLGYSAFHGIDGRGVAIGCFFAAIFTGGHLTQEVRDFEADLHSGIRTNAVAFGQMRAFVAGFALFTFAHALLVVLAISETVPRTLRLLPLLFPLHAVWSLQALRDGLRPGSVRRLQARYRVLYSGFGAVMAISVLMA